MDFKNNTLESFLDVTAGKDPVPGGGSISALCGALSAALAEMVCGLTVGRKKYIEVQAQVEALMAPLNDARRFFLHAIEEDADAYNVVFEAYKLPKETAEEKEYRSGAIEAAMKVAAQVPMTVAEKAVETLETVRTVARIGNKNAITDACVAAMCARTAALGAILNVKINLSSIADTGFTDTMYEKCAALQKKACAVETEVLDNAGV